MLNPFKRKKAPADKTPSDLVDESHQSQVTETPSSAESSVVPEKRSLFSQFKAGLRKTRASLGEGLSRLLLGKKTIDADLLEQIETQLLLADVGVETTEHISSALTEQLNRKALTDPDMLFAQLKTQLTDTLLAVEKPLVLPSSATPFVILMVGVNGAGKTTTVGKLAHRFRSQGLKVLLAAGDTFRAAAVEQLQSWGQKNDVPVVAQATGADSASVVYDAFQAAKARGVDVLIADTAGRLHTQVGLMEELKKVKRVIQKLDPNAPHETMLVLDASNGQNALRQAQEFDQALGLTGVTLTKMDGTAKGGIIFSVAHQLALPVRFVGLGEGIGDLKSFAASLFVDALFSGAEQLERAQ